MVLLLPRGPLLYFPSLSPCASTASGSQMPSRILLAPPPERSMPS